MNIKNLKRIKTKCTVYDIEVEVDHSFIVSGCVLHNCIVCGNYDGKKFKSLSECPHVPQHRNCRCLIIPYFDIKGDTRASKNGQIDSKITFEKWLEQQDEKTQKTVLGATRFKMYKDGVKFEQFVDNGRTLTIEELNEIVEE
jgi:hypothetical protein